MAPTDYTLITAHDQRDRAEMLDCAARHAFGMHWPVTGWTDTTTPRTDRPVRFVRVMAGTAVVSCPLTARDIAMRGFPHRHTCPDCKGTGRIAQWGDMARAITCPCQAH